MIRNYLEILRKEFKDKNDVQIEHLCIKDAGIRKFLKTTVDDHRQAAMKLLFPHRKMHAWRERMIRSWWECKRDRKQENIWIGSAMSTKTSTVADCFLEILWEDPLNTTILIASPFKDATRGRLWAEIVKSFAIAKQRWPHLPGEVKKSAGRIDVSEINIRSGIEMVSADDHGKLIGGNNDDVTSGNFILGVDELPAVSNSASELLEGVGNMKMRPSFTFWAGGNFAEVSDGLGRVSEPDLPGGYEALDIETDHQWDTVRNGRVYRFDGMQSPNVLAQRDDFPFITRWEVVKGYIERGQTDTADFYRWVRSFPVLGQDSKTILTTAAIRAGNGYNSPEYTADTLIRGGACDPGFGGDPCLLNEWVLGWELIRGERVQVLDFPHPPVEVPLRITKGMSVETVNKQIVAYAREWAERKHILPRNFGFDGSMRAGIVQQFMRDWSVETVAIDFGGTATERRMSSNSKKTWKEEAANFVTELWFAFQLLVEGGQARGLQNQEDAVRQLCSRWWRWAGKKKQVETKDEYKKRNQYKSPNEADTLVIALEMARRRGFTMRGGIPAGGGAIDAILQMRRQLEMRAVVNSLKGGNALPPGHLRSMEHPSAPSHGKLNSYS